jgi:N-acetylglucosaminyldiphosphoundecaprenol N-acetyl-beta-D-mannosaminyltransferase
MEVSAAEPGGQRRAGIGMTLDTPRSIYILGSKLTAITPSGLHECIANAVADNRRELILNTNVHGINLAYRQRWLRDFRNGAGVVYCDGFGVVLGARLLGERIPGRITMADWLWELAGFCEQRRLSMYFLGGKPGCAERAAQKLRAQFPELRIVGAHHGYFQKVGPECDDVVAQINQTRPNLLIVGFGMPLQERWLMDNYTRIRANTFFAQGAIFDFISGDVPRCPPWMGDAGLEWLFRLCLEPRRMFTRYVVGNALFLMRIIKAGIVMRLRHASVPSTR